MMNEIEESLYETKTKNSLRKKLSDLAKKSSGRNQGRPSSVVDETLTHVDQPEEKPEDPLTRDLIQMWADPQTGFESLLESSIGRNLFDVFLEKEFSRENLQFWIACDRLDDLKDEDKFKQQVEDIFATFIVKNTVLSYLISIV